MTGLEAVEARIDIERALDRISPKYAQVLRMRYGLGDCGAHTLKQIGEELGGRSVERIRQIEAKALRELRHPSIGLRWSFDCLIDGPDWRPIRAAEREEERQRECQRSLQAELDRIRREEWERGRPERERKQAEALRRRAEIARIAALPINVVKGFLPGHRRLHNEEIYAQMEIMRKYDCPESVVKTASSEEDRALIRSWLARGGYNDPWSWHSGPASTANSEQQGLRPAYNVMVSVIYMTPVSGIAPRQAT